MHHQLRLFVRWFWRGFASATLHQATPLHPVHSRRNQPQRCVYLHIVSYLQSLTYSTLSPETGGFRAILLCPVLALPPRLLPHLTRTRLRLIWPPLWSPLLLMEALCSIGPANSTQTRAWLVWHWITWPHQVCTHALVSWFETDVYPYIATSVDVECTFSAGWLTINNLQHNMSSETFEAKMAVGSWYGTPLLPEISDVAAIIRESM